MEFANPLYLLFLLLLIPAIVWYVLRQRGMQASLQVSTTQPFDKMPRSYKYYLRHVNFVLILLSLAFLIVALARPQSSGKWENKSTEGVDIVLALDISSSMSGRDFDPNRLEAAKDVVKKFVTGRKFDNIGLVAFAGESFTLCPMTTDHNTLLNLIENIQCGMIKDRTAIGNGLATAINRIKDGPAKSKTIILLTDGTNNAGDISPIAAAEIASTYDVRVYTIGVGTTGLVDMLVQTPYGTEYMPVQSDIDEETLREMAHKTGGEYFRANNEQALQNIFEEIDKMEKTKFSVQKYSVKQEEYAQWIILSLLCLFLHILLRQTILKNIP